MSWTKTEDKLPPAGKYVIGKHNRGTWIDNDDQKNVNTVVVKLVKGLSISDREKMKSGEIEDPIHEFRDGNSVRSRVYCSEDEDGNNLVPYNWNSFGPDSFFGQTITHWMPIPDIDS